MSPLRLLTLAIGCVAASGLSTPPASAAAQDSSTAFPAGAAPPAEMQRLDFLAGRWENETEFLDASGDVVRTFRLTRDMPGGADGYLIQRSLGGWVMEGGVGSDFGRSWYRYDPATDRYRLFASDFFGNLDILEGQFRGDSLVLTETESEPHPSGGTVRWRWVFTDISGDHYRIRQYMSRDDGASWTLVNRQRQTRLPEPPSRGGQSTVAATSNRAAGFDVLGLPLVAGTDSLRPTALMDRLIGSWEITPGESSAANGRLDVRWLIEGATLETRMTLLTGPEPAEIARGIVGFDPATRSVRGVSFQSMIWPENRLVHLMFESEYRASEDMIQRVYSVHYAEGEPLMPMPDAAGTVRRFRETYRFQDDDSILWTTEIDEGGEWKPFRGAGPGSRLDRISDG